MDFTLTFQFWRIIEKGQLTASRTMSFCCCLAAAMTDLTVFIIVGSLPSPGPMTSACSRGSHEEMASLDWEHWSDLQGRGGSDCKEWCRMLQAILRALRSQYWMYNQLWAIGFDHGGCSLRTKHMTQVSPLQREYSVFNMRMVELWSRSYTIGQSGNETIVVALCATHSSHCRYGCKVRCTSVPGMDAV